MNVVEVARARITEWTAACVVSYTAVQRYAAAREARAAAERAAQDEAGALAHAGAAVLAEETCLEEVQACMADIQRLAELMAAMVSAVANQAQLGKAATAAAAWV